MECRLVPEEFFLVESGDRVHAPGPPNGAERGEAVFLAAFIIDVFNR